MSYYIHFIDFLWEKTTEEEFRKTVMDALDVYVREKKKQQAAEEEAYKLKKLEDRMRENKDIL